MRKVTLLVCLLALAIGLSLARADEYEFYARKVTGPKPASDFSLTSKGGESFALSNLRGKVVLLYFGFTHCPNTCPTTLANLAAADALLSKDERSHTQVLFVSVDPKRDTPKVVQDYVKFFDDHFIGLTGSEAQLAVAGKPFGVEYEESAPQPGDKSYLIEHSSATYVIGPSGRWIGYYLDRQLNDSHRVADDLRHFITLAPANDDVWVSAETNKVVKTPRLSGSELYLRNCASCHLANGEGIKGKYPPLAGSPWVKGSAHRLTALLINGVTGPETVQGVTYSSVMPGWQTMLVPSDLATIETYIRQAWGNSASAISPDYVKAVFYKYIRRRDFWNWPELEALPADLPPTSPTPAGASLGISKSYTR